MSAPLGVLLASANRFSRGRSAILMLLRWIHLVAGITWVGLLYFFTLVNTPFLKELDAEAAAS